MRTRQRETHEPIVLWHGPWHRRTAEHTRTGLPRGTAHPNRRTLAASFFSGDSAHPYPHTFRPGLSSGLAPTPTHKLGPALLSGG